MGSRACRKARSSALLARWPTFGLPSCLLPAERHFVGVEGSDRLPCAVAVPVSIDSLITTTTAVAGAGSFQVDAVVTIGLFDVAL